MQIIEVNCLILNRFLKQKFSWQEGYGAFSYSQSNFGNVIDYIKNNNLPYVVYDRHGLSHSDILTIMGKSLLYIGNSISDGMPNTLLEAIVMGAFPIQSNPGKVTEEIIEHKMSCIGELEILVIVEK